MASASGIETVAIVGGGFMGTGIAEAVAVTGLRVVVRDVDQASVERGRARIESSLAESVRGARLDSAEADAVRARIEVTTELDAIADADLVIEAVPEQLDVKLAVMRGIDSVVREEAIVASNTSAIPITELAHALRRPERVLGMHFFPPVPVVALVEIIVGLATSRETVDTAESFAKRLGKTVIETKDRSGFIVNMLLVPYLMAAVRMYEDGFASRDDIDTGMKLGCGHPMGPLTVCDLIGLDNLYAVCNSLYEEYKRTEYAPPPLLKRMVASGRLGRKSGSGFYDYQ
jgi:3-hydroxybutyryl-CoA dehydrogenase